MSYDIDQLKLKMGTPNSSARGRPRHYIDRDPIMMQLHEEGYSYAQIGEVFGISGTSVFYALKRLREQKHLT